QHGYEVVIFHATGTGGKAMEDLIRSGYFEGVLDLTTTEWADQLCGGVLSAGESRLDAAIENNIPQVVSLGALDMVNFGPK
ncbi:Tm-1-like ATP-binding domain-containing protein, partial [Staphylococcus lugdunensis]